MDGGSARPRSARPTHLARCAQLRLRFIANDSLSRDLLSLTPDYGDRWAKTSNLCRQRVLFLSAWFSDHAIAEQSRGGVAGFVTEKRSAPREIFPEESSLTIGTCAACELDDASLSL